MNEIFLLYLFAESTFKNGTIPTKIARYVGKVERGQEECEDGAAFSVQLSVVSAKGKNITHVVKKTVDKYIRLMQNDIKAELETAEDDGIESDSDLDGSVGDILENIDATTSAGSDRIVPNV